jgi:hypothetical protein
MKVSHTAIDSTLSVVATPPTASHRRTLEKLFRHPAAQNIDWDDALALFEVIGDVEHKNNDKWLFQIGAEHQLMHQPHGKDLTGDEVIELRKFLQRAGWSAQGELTPAPASSVTMPSLMIVVDHHEAKIYRIATDARDASRKQIQPYDPHHFLHHLTHKDQDRERGQRAPEDPSFYVRITAALTGAGAIVVVGHGTGHSNAAHRLMEYLRAHSPETHARVVREVTADLSSVTPAQLLDIAGQTAC